MTTQSQEGISSQITSQHLFTSPAVPLRILVGKKYLNYIFLFPPLYYYILLSPSIYVPLTQIYVYCQHNYSECFDY